MSSARFECQKFSPNFFDKSKCQNCFRPKDRHSAEALESNRASRKISKCGYLFVAPDWDFSNPLYRTKRWQRRWFVLYEDGELTYSVDEHPETVPQAVIDMTKVVKVSDAEDVTGNQFAVSISTAEKIHFIKGTCKEESKWWFDVLVMYPRNVKGRQKRNGTFPCIVATKNLTSTSIKSRPVEGRGSWNETIIPRHRFLSCHTDPSCLNCDKLSGNTGVKQSAEIVETNAEKGEYGDGLPRDIELIIADNSLTSRTDHMKRTTRRENKKQLYSRSRSVGPLPCKTSMSKEESGGRSASPYRTADVATSHRVTSPLYVRMSDVPMMKRYDSLESLHNDQNGPLSPRPWCQVDDDVENEDECFPGSETTADNTSHKQYKLHSSPNGTSHVQRSVKKDSEAFSRSRAPSNVLRDRLLGNSGEKLEMKPGVSRNDDVLGDNSWRETTVRGDPDGCGLDHIVGCPSTISESRPDPLDSFSEKLLNTKKGWLMRQDGTGKWCKQWCLLYGSSLKLFRDQMAEESGNWDSIISMNLVQHVEEADAGRNYGFKIKMTDGKGYVFSALTAGIRSSWILALQNAANMRDRDRSLAIRREILQPAKDLENRNPNNIPTASLPTLTFSTEKPLRTVLGGHIQPLTSHNSTVDDSENSAADQGSSRALLPASPPLNRTAISKVKERARHKVNGKLSPKQSSNNSNAVGHDEEELTDKRNKEQNVSATVTGPWNPKMTDKDTEKEIGGRSTGKSSTVRDKDRRSTLPGKEGSPLSKLADLPVAKVSGRPASSNKEKASKWQGDERHDGRSERDQHIESLQTRLRRSEDKIHDLESEVEVLCKIKVKLSDEDDGKPEISNGQNVEIDKLKEALDRANGELVDVVNRLQKATDENEALRKVLTASDCKSGADASGGSGVNGKKWLPRVGSLSDLTNIGEELDVDSATREMVAEKYKELRARFEKAVNEIKALKKELKEAYGKYDELEVACMNRKHEAQALENDYKSQLSLMSVRIEDLTAKLSNSEKQLRNQLTANKPLRSSGRESKEQRRTRSLKGREALTVSKEVENKVEDLEKKLQKVEALLQNWDGSEVEESGSLKRQWASPSPDGQQQAEGADSSKHVFVRLNCLESKVNGVTQKLMMAHSVSSSSRTSLANDCELDDGSLPAKSEECPSDCDTSDRDAPVALISELNGKVEGLRGRTLELELALRICRKKVEQCRSIMNEVETNDDVLHGEKIAALQDVLQDIDRWLTGSDLSPGQFLVNFYPYFVVKMKEHLLARSDFILAEQQASKNESDVPTLLSDRDTLKSSILKSIIRTLSLEPLCSVCPHGLLLRNAKRIQKIVKKSLRKLRVVNSCIPDVERSKETKEANIVESGMYSSKALQSLLEELSDDELLLRATVASRRDETIHTLVDAIAVEAKMRDTDFDNLPTVVLLKELFFQTERVIARNLAEVEVVDAILRLLHTRGDFDAVVFDHLSLETLCQLQKLEDRKTRLIAEHLANEMESTFEVLRTALERAVSQDRPRQGVVQELQVAQVVPQLRAYVEVASQVALCSACLAFIHNVISSVGLECPGDGLCTFANVNNSNSEFSEHFPPPPRVVGGVVKPGAYGCSTEGSSPTLDHDFSASHSSLETSWPTVAEAGMVKAGAGTISDRTAEQTKEGSSIWRSDRKADTRGVGDVSGTQGHCQQCKELQRKVQQMAEKYASDLLLETERHQTNLDALYKQQAENLSKLEISRSDEIVGYQEEIKALQDKLIAVEEDYEQQVLSLKETFELEISKRTNIKLNKANVQQKYRAEIEQLKNLCEKGLVAMEHSHRRIIAEMEEKHRCEMEQLLAEKEQALAEETQATLAALDAMRKAHETELQKEVARFKDEFLKKMGHSSADLDVLRRQHKQEMENIKSKILDISEKYSVKCLECASLEEHLEVTTEKLAEANSLIFELTARNRQLRSHLRQNIRELSQNATENQEKRNGDTLKDLQLSLELKEKQLVEKDEEIADLTRRLTATKIHESELENQCRFLDASLEAGQKATDREDVVDVLRAKLEQIISSSQQKHPDRETPSRVSDKRLSKKTQPSSAAAPHRSPFQTTETKLTTVHDSLRNKEFLRALSCPSFREPDISTSKTDVVPLVGVVASRKRIFEDTTHS